MSNEIIDGLNYLKDTKDLIRQSIIDKGVEVDSSLPFRQYADKIGEISGGGGEVVIKGYRQFEKVGSGTLDNIDDNYILSMDSDNKTYLKQLIYDTSYGCEVCTKVKIKDITSDTGVLFGGNGGTFAVGLQDGTKKLGVWGQTHYGNNLDGNTSSGQVDYELDLNKWYFLRFTFKGYTIYPFPKCLFSLDIKENENDSYQNIFSREASGLFRSSLSEICFGGATYGGQTAICDIDLKYSYGIQFDSPNQGYRSIHVPFN